MKLLVTGSAGLVGSACVSLFEEKGWEVVGVDNNMRAHLFGTPKQFTRHNIDIRSEIDMENLFARHKFDAIIHAAAQPSHDWAKREPLTDFDINARATLILLEATRKHCPNATFVHVSTDKVYGENMECPKIELVTRFESLTLAWGFGESLGLDFAGQRSLFGCSKTAADIYAQEYANYFGMKIGVFRPGCITGKNHQGAEYHGFLAYLAHCIKHEKPYKIFGYKGKQVRDQIHASDLASAFWHFIQNPKEGAVYNIGGGPERSVSILEAIALLEKATGKKAIVEYVNEARRGDRVWDVHDIAKFRKDYPEWNYQYSLQDIVNELAV